MSSSPTTSPLVFRCSSFKDVDEDQISIVQSNVSDKGEEPSMPSSTPVLVHHPEFWLADGSVVLQAKNTFFRVHKTFLARHSVIFRDMFALPQPSSSSSRSSLMTTPEITQEEYEGCPVVQLYDSPEDVASLLFALYDGPKFGNNDRADFRVVSGILRLASKYLIDSLRKKALAHLSVAWPSTLKAWDAREELTGENVSDSLSYYPCPVEVINLAREINAPTLLPSAFYDLARYPLSDIFERNPNAPEWDPADVQYGLQSLSLADTQKLVLGRESVQYAVTSLIRSMATEARCNPNNPSYNRDAHHLHHLHHHVHTPTGQVMRGHLARHRRTESALSTGNGSSLRCTSPSACWHDMSELVNLATQHYLFDRNRGAMDPLYVAEELALLKGSEISGSPSSATANRNDIGEGGSDCKGCARAFELWAQRERERLWRAIPSWFRLDHP